VACCQRDAGFIDRWWPAHELVPFRWLALPSPLGQPAHSQPVARCRTTQAGYAVDVAALCSIASYTAGVMAPHTAGEASGSSRTRGLLVLRGRVLARTRSCAQLCHGTSALL
jgi:hypothetical protein